MERLRRNIRDYGAATMDSATMPATLATMDRATFQRNASDYATPTRAHCPTQENTPRQPSGRRGFFFPGLADPGGLFRAGLGVAVAELRAGMISRVGTLNRYTTPCGGLRGVVAHFVCRFDTL